VANAPRISSDLRAHAWEALRKAGMAIPYPTRTLHLAPRATPRRRQEPQEAAGDSSAEPAPQLSGAAAGSAPTSALGVQPPGAPQDSPSPARLYVLEGPERGHSLALSGAPATVGRSRGCTLALTDPNASKEHLRITWENGSYVLTDLGSSFGTRLNGQAVSRAALSPLDRIAIGDTVMIFESDEP
jgi:hypothetical protein